MQKDVGRAEQAYRAVIATRQGAGAPTLGAANTLVDLAFVAIGHNDFAGAERTLRVAVGVSLRRR